MAVAVVLVAVACGESLVSSGDSARAPSSVPAVLSAPGPVAGPVADSSFATVAEIPGWEEVVRELDYRECAVYWRRDGGEYELDVAEIEYSAEAMSGPWHAVQVATLLLETSIVGVRAHCLFPYTEAGREELLEHLSFMFPADVPGEGGEDGEGGPQADGDPCPEYEGEGKATHQCPNITATVVKPCPVGFDRDKFSGACVSNFTINTGNPGGGPGTGGPGGSSPGSTTPPDDNDDDGDDEEEDDDEEDDDEIPPCTPDQVAIAEEYNDPGWSCEIFIFPPIPGDGTHGHDTGYLAQAYTAGMGAVVEFMAGLGYTGFEITSDWRCPKGNEAVGGVPDSQHVMGLAGDVTVAGFGDDAKLDFWRAAKMTQAGYFKDDYNTIVHIDWGPNRGSW